MEFKEGFVEPLDISLAVKTVSGKLSIDTTTDKLPIEVDDERNEKSTSESQNVASASSHLEYLNFSRVLDFELSLSKKYKQLRREDDVISRDFIDYACAEENALWTGHQGCKQELYCDKCLNSFDNPLHDKPTAVSMCFDCSKYLCVNCLTIHSSHLSYRIDDGNNQIDRKTFFRNMLTRTRADSLNSANTFDKEKLVVCDRVNAKFSEDAVAGEVEDICTLDSGKIWVMTERNNRCIKLFDASNNRLVRCIRLSSGPAGITEIPPDGSSISLNIAVAFPSDREIIVLDLLRIPSRILQSISVQGTCRQIFSCDENIVVYCEERNKYKSIHIIDKDGETLNTINVTEVLNVPGKCFSDLSPIRVCFDRSSKTIYISSFFDRILVSCDISGQFLNSFKFDRMYPSAICVDSDSHVYVLVQDKSSYLYKLSKDLSWSEQVFEDTVCHVERVKTMTMCRDKFYFVHGWDMHHQNIVTVMRRE